MKTHWTRRIAAANLIAIALSLSLAVTSFAAVWTDQPDYSPGNAVTMSGDNSDGAGFLAGEAVHVEVSGPNGYAASCGATADENGAWSCQVTLWDNELAVGSYEYTATGQVSLVSQSGTFTDGTVSAAPLSTYESDCNTPTGNFTIGGTVCAKTTITTNPSNQTGDLRIEWTGPTGVAVRTTSYTDKSNGATLSDSYAPGATGQWTVRTLKGTSGASLLSSKTFLVTSDSTPPDIAVTCNGAECGAGWYTGDVAVDWTVSDAQSSHNITDGCVDTTISIDTAATVLTCSAASEGGSNSSSVTIKRDATAPTITGSVSGTTGANGWHISDVTVSFTCSDATSGIATCTGDTGLSSEGTGQSVTGTATDQAGNSANATVAGINIDKTGPTAEMSVANGTLGSNGWYTSDVTIRTTGGDAVSGPATCTGDQHFASDSAGTAFTGSCTNDAGLTTHAAPLIVKRDATAPTISGAPDRAPNAAGWYDADVTVAFTCADALSGVAHCADPVLVGEGADQSETGLATDLAGNVASATVGNIDVDKTGPSAALAVTAGTPGANGWYTSDVTVSTTGSDSLSGVAACTAVQFQTTETSGATFTGSCTDKAGHTASATPLTVKLDKTGPSAALAVTAGTPGANGWYTSDVTVSTTGFDLTSGPVSCTGAQLQTIETAGTGFNGSCTNDAGLTTHAVPLTVKLDKTSPTIAVARTPANGYGWNNADVTVSFTCADALSGVAACAAPQTLSDEGAGLSVTGMATDSAGNSASATVSDINIDKTPPVASAHASPDRNAHGWNNTDVTVSFGGSDGLSGIDWCDAPVLLSAEDAGQSASGTCADFAGNVSEPAVASGINIDKTAPTIAAAPERDPDHNDWYNANVAVRFTCLDGLSGIPSGACPADQVLSDEGTAIESAAQIVSDTAGNTSVLSNVVTVKIDKTAPAMVAELDRGPADTGWFNASTGAPTVAFTCADATSGVVSCPTAHTFGEGAGQSYSGTVYDNAGNSASAAVSGVYVDLTAPTILGAPDRAPNAAGWYNAGVTVSFICDDALSGLDGACPAAVTLGEGANQSVTGAATDLAGNTASATVADIDIDKTAPTSVSGAPTRAPDHNGWYNHPVEVAFVGNDSLSGIAACDSPTYSGPDSAIASILGGCTDLADNRTETDSAEFRYDATRPELHPSTSPYPVLLNGSATANPNASDNLSGVDTENCGPVDTASVGSKSVTCTATDQAGNETEETFEYHVVYATGGTCLGSPGHALLPPIDSGGWSIFRRGSTVPAKFRVCDANGVSIGEPGTVASFMLTQRVSGLVHLDFLEEVPSTTPNTEFRWDSTAKQWVYNISTKPYSANTTYFFTITLNDGSTIGFSFGLK